MSTVIPSPATDLRDEQQAEAIAGEAYLFLYPLVMMDTTRRQMTNAAAGGGQPGFGPMNAFSHMRAFPPVEFKAVPWANFDTLYSLAWLDVTSGAGGHLGAGHRRPLLPVADPGHVDGRVRGAGQARQRHRGRPLRRRARGLAR
jgi:hypothetical protein